MVIHILVELSEKNVAKSEYTDRTSACRYVRLYIEISAKQVVESPSE